MDQFYADSFYSWLFVILGCVLLFLEVFVPSGGILGISAFGCAAFGIFGFWWQGHAALAMGLIIGYLGYAAMMMRFVLHRVRFSAALTPDSSTSVDERIQHQLLEAEGVALTPLRPAGSAVIRGQRYDVVTLGDFIDKDTPVKVVDISGNRIVVRQCKSSRSEESHGDG
jgi:membrane-bound serine protease (ClpP class)